MKIITMRGVIVCCLISCCTIIKATNSLVKDVSEFNTAVSNAQAGDTIQLKNGTWNNATLKFYANGTAGNPIVLTSETPGMVTLTGSSKLAIYGKYLEVHHLDFKNGALTGDAVISFRKSSSELAENCRVTNCRILNYNPQSDDIAYKWVSIYGKNNRVDHSTFTGKNHEGALLVVWLNGTANYHQIDHNYFSDIPRLNRNGAETIRIGTSTNSFTESRSVVEYNVFEKCDGEIEVISNKSCFNIYRYNTFRNNDGGLTLRHGNDCEVYGNFFFGTTTKSCSGVRIIGERHKVYNNYFQDLEGTGTRAAICLMNGVPNSPLNRYFQVKDAEVMHNTIVSCKQALSFGAGKSDELSLPPLNPLVANNIIDKSSAAPISYVDNPINITYAANIVFYNNLNLTDTGIINQNPGLTLSNGLWRTDRSSNAYNAAAKLRTYVVSDMDGQTRDDSPDIGSDEVSEETITNKPLAKNDVGANWDNTTAGIVHDLMNFTPNVYAVNQSIHFSNVPSRFTSFQIQVIDMRSQIVSSLVTTNPSKPIQLLQAKGVYIVRLFYEGQSFYQGKIVL